MLKITSQPHDDDHDACIENLLLRLILFTFRIKLKGPPLRQMSDFTLSPPYLGSNFM